MNIPSGRPPHPDAWRKNTHHRAAAARVCSGLAALNDAAAELRNRRPPLQSLFDMIERLESVARALQQLTLPPDSTAPSPPSTAASITSHVADTGRALAKLTVGWHRHIPDPAAQQDALRLCNAICRSLVRLASIERRKES